jgi:predicted ABC-type ATPase
MASPQLVIIAGPNGAGKTTAAPRLLQGTLGVVEFVNADVIARGLSGFAPEGAALQAGRVMLSRMKELATRRVDFAFETTLATRSFVPWITGLHASGYGIQLVFLWLPDPEAALRRVEERVRKGGHRVDADVVRRRYHRGLRNFFTLYRPLADAWRFYDNSSRSGPRLLASGAQTATLRIADERLWRLIVTGSAGGRTR